MSILHNGIICTELASFKPGNPYRQDLERMGTGLEHDIEAMYSNCSKDRYIILVDKRTGRRVKVTFEENPDEKESLAGGD